MLAGLQACFDCFDAMFASSCCSGFDRGPVRAHVLNTVSGFARRINQRSWATVADADSDRSLPTMSLLPPSHLFLDLLEGPGDRDNYFFLSFAVFLGFGFCFVGFCGLREDFDLGCLGINKGQGYLFILHYLRSSSCRRERMDLMRLDS